MSAKPRTRLSVDARREQLLDVGISLSVERQVDDISIDDVTAAAGVSRALFYCYFKNKREFVLASIQRACDQMMEATEPDDSVPEDQRLKASIDNYFDHAEANADTYRAVHQGAWAGDPEVRTIMANSMKKREDLMLASMSGSGASPDLLRTAIRGWLSFVVVNLLDWMETGEPSRDELRDLCADVLMASLAAAFGQSARREAAAPRAA